MKSIYFVDNEHELNFKRVQMKWAGFKDNTEYLSACYILAVPMIFNKIESSVNNYRYPTDWIWNYLSWQEEYKKDWERYDRYGDKLHPEYEAWIDRKPMDLSNSMVQLGKFSLNLWNSYDDFNLMDCLGGLDEKNYNVLKCAIAIRMGEFMD